MAHENMVRLEMIKVLDCSVTPHCGAIVVVTCMMKGKTHSFTVLSNEQADDQLSLLYIHVKVPVPFRDPVWNLDWSGWVW